MSIFKGLTLLLCATAFGVYAQAAAPMTQDAIVDKATGESFPAQVSFTHNGKTYQLQATGVSTRKKFFVKVYSVASYLQADAVRSGGDILAAILQDSNAKQLTIKWVRGVEAAKIQEGYRESFKSALTDSESAQLQDQVNTFIQWFSRDVQKGDEHVLRWLPGGYIEVLANGTKVGSLTNVNFAKGVWNIWFGTKSVVDRNNLLSIQ